jgi:hypothetical protein
VVLTLASDGSEGTDENKTQVAIVESFLGAGIINAITNGLSSAGLTCKLNPYGNILQYSTDIVTSLPDGTFFFLSQGKKVLDADFTFQHDPFDLQDELPELLSDANIGSFRSHYSHSIQQEEERSFKSSSIEQTKETLKHIGCIIGSLSAGAFINPGEIGTSTDLCTLMEKKFQTLYALWSQILRT